MSNCIFTIKHLPSMMHFCFHNDAGNLLEDLFCDLPITLQTKTTPMLRLP